MNPNIKKLSCLVGIAASLCGVSSLSAQNLFFTDFETDLGSPIYLNSGSNYDVDRRSESNSPFPASEGAALRIRDRTSTPGEEPSIEWELASAVSAAAFSFDFVIKSSPTGGSLRFGFGQETGSASNELSSSSDMIATVIISPSSFIYRQAGSDSNVSNSTVTGDATGTFDVFVNDFDNQSVNYTRPDNGNTETLGTNTLSYWFNDSLVGNVDFSDGTVSGTTLGNSEGNIGRFGFNALNENNGIVTHYDNVSVDSLAVIPEPGTYALLFGALALGFAAIRRR